MRSGSRTAAQADLVIGQRDFFSTGANGPGVSGGLSTGFAAPTGLAVDQGDLYVADSGNNRVLRFRKPFTTPPDQLTPDLCIGQPSFNANKPNYPLGQNTTPTEKGIALEYRQPFSSARSRSTPSTTSGWRMPETIAFCAMRPADVAKGGFATTISANLEIGQLDFISRQPNLPDYPGGLQTLNQLATPAAIAFDAVGPPVHRRFRWRQP